MPMTAAEQYFLELLNRARMDPGAEATRQRVALNQGLPDGPFGPIANLPQEILAPQAQLDRAAESHSSWMARTATFSHEGAEGSTDITRVQAAGYVLDHSGGWRVGENLAWSSGGTPGTESMMSRHFNTLWNSPQHRSNMMGGQDLSGGAFPTFNYREIGVAEVASANGDYLTLDFAYAGSRHYITGVAYRDIDRDNFYSVGEAISNVVFNVVGTGHDVSEAAGGYAVATRQTGEVTVRVTHNNAMTEVKVNTGGGRNVKLDLEVDPVTGATLLSNAHLTLLRGPIADARLLGVEDRQLIGSGISNDLTGNAGRNTIKGFGGNDRLVTGAGNDTGFGGVGNDTITGQGGNDLLFGEAGRDVLSGGLGTDRLVGGTGNDVLSGGAGADRFVFNAGNGFDRVTDFARGQGDRLVLDDALWGNAELTAAQVVNRFAEVGAGFVEFDFGPGEVLRLNGLTSKIGLAAYIDII